MCVGYTSQTEAKSLTKTSELVECVCVCVCVCVCGCGGGGGGGGLVGGGTEEGEGVEASQLKGKWRKS